MSPKSNVICEDICFVCKLIYAFDIVIWNEITRRKIHGQVLSETALILNFILPNKINFLCELYITQN